MTEVVEGTAEEIGTEVVPHQPSGTLFRTDDPVEVVKRATEVADALKSVLTGKSLTVNVKGKEHVLVEGWTTLGSMLGVVPIVVWTRKLENGWEARVEARTLDGRVVGSAEAECLREESRWKTADDYAIRSMAQTRATSKALRGPLGFIVTLAGHIATPAEEMPADAPTVELIDTTADKTFRRNLGLLVGDPAAAKQAYTMFRDRYQGIPAPAAELLADIAVALPDGSEIEL